MSVEQVHHRPSAASEMPSEIHPIDEAFITHLPKSVQIGNAKPSNVSYLCPESLHPTANSRSFPVKFLGRTFKQ